MWKVLVGLGLVTIGCGAPARTMFRATIDASAAPSTVEVETYFAIGSPGSMPVATPDILAGTAPPATAAMTWTGFAMVGAGVHGEPVVVGLEGGAGIDGPLYVGALGLGEAGISGAWSGPIEDPEQAMVTLRLDPGLQPEVWGTPSGTGQCFRLNIGAATVFIEHGNDPDCDGLTGAEDTQPYAYCDPTATSGPARDACQ